MALLRRRPKSNNQASLNSYIIFLLTPTRGAIYYANEALLITFHSTWMLFLAVCLSVFGIPPLRSLLWNSDLVMVTVNYSCLREKPQISPVIWRALAVNLMWVSFSWDRLLVVGRRDYRRPSISQCRWRASHGNAEDRCIPKTCFPSVGPKCLHKYI